MTNYGFFRYHQVSYGVTSRFLFKDGRPGRRGLLARLGADLLLLARGRASVALPRRRRRAPLLGGHRDAPVLPPGQGSASTPRRPTTPITTTCRACGSAARSGPEGGGDFLTVNWFTSRNSWIAGVDPALIALYNRDQVGAFAGLRLPRARPRPRGRGRLQRRGREAPLHGRPADLPLPVRRLPGRRPLLLLPRSAGRPGPLLAGPRRDRPDARLPRGFGF
ncbi:MAG: hypothetical protein M0C28_05375 [Candidatus Moduliflexus flocculans]|nr:hypothetical protein [Candidatus Moduliflexus flocculans]